MALALALAADAGCKTETEGEVATAAPVRLGGDRFRVDLFDDDHALGGDQPLVTVVVFSDYSCPPCGRTWKVMDNLVEDYGPDLRVVFRAFTVQSLPRSERAAEAAEAAGAQGKFWEMHRRLFEQGGDYDRPTLRALAEAMGLDVARFLDDLDTGAHAGARMRHRRQAKGLGVTGLPAAFVNGKYLAGYADEATWHGILDGEIAMARELMRQGTPRAQLYATLMRDASTRPVGAAPGEQELRRTLEEQAASPVDVKALRPPDASQRYAVRVGEAPATGAADAPVEVVMFFDFECPYCRRAWEQEVGVLVRSQPDGVRLGVRQLPLEIHPSARGAALAALAAGRQGRFWAMFDRLVAHDAKTSLGRSDFEAYAEQIGLDPAQFLRDLDDPALAQQVEADTALADRLGIGGTPGFFVNGRYLSGFSPGSLTAMVEEEQAAAQALVDAGTPRAEVVDALMKDAVPESEFPNR
ncbi:MAG: thioredoxin domain-containing protein [Myxococcales bacterium]|nr:thioredoxin domain-containing protein [Myxococcales bacterium]MCB9715524.1 thioredoxin domain-containing protein [Myxococcales bacterium]